MKKIIATAVFFSVFNSYALEMNDISVLLPLPKSTQEKDELIRPSTQGLGGEILGENAYSKVPSLVFGENRKTRAQNVFALGMRIDPCFQEGSGQQICQKQIRIVWQPITDNFSTIDAAYHSFYSLDEAQFRGLMGEMRELSKERGNRDGEALFIHPTISKEGLTGNYWKKMKQIILRYAGARNLSRLTVMTVSREKVENGKAWTFEGVNLANSKSSRVQATKMKMHGSQDYFQGFMLRGNDLNKFSYRFIPRFNGASVVKRFLVNSDHFKKSPDGDLGLALELVKLSNPRLNNPGTTDCMSCHTAKSIQDDMTEHNSDFLSDASVTERIFKSRHNLSNLTPVKVSANNLRAFGYFQTQPILSQRVINETAGILDSLQVHE